MLADGSSKLKAEEMENVRQAKKLSKIPEAAEKAGAKQAKMADKAKTKLEKETWKEQQVEKDKITIMQATARIRVTMTHNKK